MANQMIALQARNPQLPDPARITAQYANMMNTAAQQRAAQLQGERTRQEMDFARAEEGRKVALQAPAMEKAGAEASGARLKYVMDYLDTSALALANSRNPQQAMALGDRMKQMFPEPELQQAIDETLASIPQDPGQFEEWRKDSLMRTMDSKDQLSNEFTTQNLGTSTRVLRTPKFGGGAGEVVEGSEAAVDIKPTVVNVEGVGPVIVDPNTGMGYSVGAGQPGGYTPPARGTAGGAPAKGGVAAALQTNPGAIKDSAFAKSQPGYAGASGGFATFKTPEDGVRAQENLLRGNYVNKGFNTIDKIINRYAPQGPENSAASVNNYKSYVARQTGIDMNAPIAANQIPAVAKAMREFETGQTQGRGTASVSAGAPKTFQQAETEKGFKKTLDLFNYNPKTGEDTITPLIKASTSGGLEKLGSESVGFVTGKATPGRVALGQLASLKDNMTFEKLRGKLGAQISDADVRLVASTMGDIANADIPANERAAKWKNVVLPILVRGAGMTPATQKAAPKGGAAKTPTLPTLTPEQVRANPNIKRWKTTDGRIMTRP